MVCDWLGNMVVGDNDDLNVSTSSFTIPLHTHTRTHTVVPYNQNNKRSVRISQIITISASAKDE